MAQLIIGNDAVFEAMHTVNQGSSMRDFVQSAADRYHQTFGHVTSAVTSFVNEWQTQYLQSDAMRKATALLRMGQSFFSEDAIRPLREVWELQNAPARMLRGVMAMPEARKLHSRGMCYGYGNRYEDLFPTKRPEEHRDYKYVYDGAVIDGVEDDDVDFTYVLYGDDFTVEDDYEFLTVDQKDDIKDTRTLMQKAIEENRDFTDPNDEALR